MIQSNEIEVSSVSSDFHLKYTKEIIFSIRRLMQAGELYTKELNKVYNISSAQLNCLLILHESGSLSPSQIAKLVLVNSSTVTGIIDRLEAKGLVRRLRISKDRRKVTVELTENGKALAQNAPPQIQQKIFDGLSKLSQVEIKNISHTLLKLTDMLDVQDLEVV